MKLLYLFDLFQTRNLVAYTYAIEISLIKSPMFFYNARLSKSFEKHVQWLLLYLGLKTTKPGPSTLQVKKRIRKIIFAQILMGQDFVLMARVN